MGGRDELTPRRAGIGGTRARCGGRRARRAACFALTLLAALAVSRLGPSRYDATAQILLQQPDQVNAVLNPDAITSAANVQREVNTNAQLITSVPVLDAVRRELGVARGCATARGPAVGGRRGDVEPRRDHGGGHGPPARRRGRHRRRGAVPELPPPLGAGGDRLRGGRRRRPPGGHGRAARRSAEGQALEARLHQLETGAAVATGGVQVVRPASVPVAAEPRLPPLTAAVVVLLGVTLAGVAVLVLERVDRRLLDEADVASAFGHPVIGRVPAPGARPGGARRRIEAFDALAVKLRSRQGPGRVMIGRGAGRRTPTTTSPSGSPRRSQTSSRACC